MMEPMTDWRVDINAGGCVSIESPDGRVASVCPGDGKTAEIVAAARGRLLAAAPDLLAACKTGRGDARSAGLLTNPIDPDNAREALAAIEAYLDRIGQTLDAAIAKAEGDE